MYHGTTAQSVASALPARAKNQSLLSRPSSTSLTGAAFRGSAGRSSGSSSTGVESGSTRPASLSAMIFLPGLQMRGQFGKGVCGGRVLGALPQGVVDDRHLAHRQIKFGIDARLKTAEQADVARFLVT